MKEVQEVQQKIRKQEEIKKNKKKEAKRRRSSANYLGRYFRVENQRPFFFSFYPWQETFWDSAKEIANALDLCLGWWLYFSYLVNLVGGDGVIKMATNNVWEIVDNDFVDVACAKCAHDFLVERGVKDHAVGENYYNADAGLFAQEDVFGEHAGQEHRCNCGVDLV